jgi:hypothetical protein
MFVFASKGGGGFGFLSRWMLLAFFLGAI